MSVTFKPSLDTVARSIAKRGEDMADFLRPNARVAVILDAWVQRNFKSEGALAGGWAPFARGGRWMPGVGLDTSAKLLQDTGRLRASFEAFYDREEAGIGSDIEYSVYHEEGTSRLPARRMLPQSADVMPSIMDVYNEHFSQLSARRLW